MLREAAKRSSFICDLYLLELQKQLFFLSGQVLLGKFNYSNAFFSSLSVVQKLKIFTTSTFDIRNCESSMMMDWFSPLFPLYKLLFPFSSIQRLQIQLLLFLPVWNISFFFVCAIFTLSRIICRFRRKMFSLWTVFVLSYVTRWHWQLSWISKCLHLKSSFNAKHGF